MSTIVGPVTLHHPELIDVYCKKMSTVVGQHRFGNIYKSGSRMPTIQAAGGKTCILFIR